MVNILLVCAQGMSTSLIVKKMITVAENNGIEANIWAVGNGQIQDEYQKADIILLGPQIRFRKKSVEDQIGGYCPVETIDMVDYGTVNGEAILNKALKRLQQ